MLFVHALPAAFSRPTKRSATLALVLALAATLLIIAPVHSSAQTALPTAAPLDPTAPDDDSNFDLTGFITARTPAVSILVAGNGLLGGNPTRIVPVQLSVNASVLSIVNLPLSSGGKAPAATVTLTYGLAWAGQSVWIKPTQGGTCSVLDAATGKTATMKGGFYLQLDALGTGTFTFQPPDRNGTFPIRTFLCGVTTKLPFLVR